MSKLDGMIRNPYLRGGSVNDHIPDSAGRVYQPELVATGDIDMDSASMRPRLGWLDRQCRNLASGRGVAPAILLGGIFVTGGLITYSLAMVQDIGQVLVADPWARVAVGIQFIMSVFVAGAAWQQVRASMKVQAKLEKTLEAIQAQQHEDRRDIARHDVRLNHLEDAP